MLDRRFVVENADLVEAELPQSRLEGRRRRFVALEAEPQGASRPKSKRSTASANEVSKSIGKAKDAAEREARKEQGRRLREADDRPLQTEIDAIAAEVGRHSAAPSPTCRIPTRRAGPTTRPIWKSAAASTPPPKFDFQPLDHVVLGERLELVDFEGGAKVAGHGFYFLKNDAVLLELALQRYARRPADRRRLHADDHARPGPQRNVARHRLHSPRAGDANL